MQLLVDGSPRKLHLEAVPALQDPVLKAANLLRRTVWRDVTPFLAAMASSRRLLVIVQHESTFPEPALEELVLASNVMMSDAMVWPAPVVTRSPSTLQDLARVPVAGQGVATVLALLGHLDRIHDLVRLHQDSKRAHSR
ncbi:hypothetical protein ON010_g18357 [Phytophthora cinnamomi]|nr:hypothetical protein ON010_g18357 [Phytophthora cinnamomi]